MLLFSSANWPVRTTIFFHMLKDHPNVSWLNQFARRYPDRIYINRLFLRMLRYPILGMALQKHTSAGEHYSYWDRVFTGFKLPYIDLFSEDVIRDKNAFHKANSECLEKKRDEFIAEFAG